MLPSRVDALEGVLRGLDDSQREELRRVADELGIDPTDALWSVLAALQYYKVLYSTIPGEIAQAVTETIEKSKQTTEFELLATRAKIEQSLIETVSETAKKVAVSMSKRQLYGWIGGWVASGAVAFGLIFWLGYSAGGDAGFNRGSAVALNVNAAAVWSATPDGQEAFKLWKAGDIAHLANCDRPGWERKGGVCYPQNYGGRIFGWNVE
jgi:hypothetical protein